MINTHKQYIVHDVLRGTITIAIVRPIILGPDSTCAASPRSLTNFCDGWRCGNTTHYQLLYVRTSINSLPMSRNSISRPRNCKLSLTLLPLAINFSAALNLTW